MASDSLFQIVSCSGASNTGKYADEVARRFSDSGESKMICLAKIAVGDPALVKNILENLNPIVVLDGCPVNCAKKLLAREGIRNIIHIHTTDFGIVKGQTPFCDEKTDAIISHIKNLVIKINRLMRSVMPAAIISMLRSMRVLRIMSFCWLNKFLLNGQEILITEIIL